MVDFSTIQWHWHRSALFQLLSNNDMLTIEDFVAW